MPMTEDEIMELLFNNSGWWPHHLLANEPALHYLVNQGYVEVIRPKAPFQPHVSITYTGYRYIEKKGSS